MSAIVVNLTLDIAPVEQLELRMMQDGHLAELAVASNCAWPLHSLVVSANGVYERVFC